MSEQVLISELKPHPRNPNKHSPEQIDRLSELIRYQGWRLPIIVSKQSGYIISGHGRLEAAKKLGLKEVPVSYQDFIDETQEYAFLVSDNSIASWAELDLASINSFVPDLGPDFNIDLLGIKDFVLEPVEKLSPQCDEDEVPEHVEPRTKLGDIYLLGNHRLMCGDSTSIDAVDKLMNGEKADMVFTDPPYDFSSMKPGNILGSSMPRMQGIEKQGIDKFDPAQLLRVWADTHIYFCNRPLIPDYLKLADNWDVSWDLGIYHKQNTAPNYGSHLMTDLEYIFILGKQSVNCGTGEPKDLYSKLFSANKDKDNIVAWSKPVAICEKFIKIYSCSTVLDLFGGSGSTLIACEKTNRKCFMMEIDPHYCDVIVTRWEKYTGKKAELINGEA